MIRDVLSLSRPRVSLAVAAGSLFGSFYHGAVDPWPILGVVAGSFFLCAACSALNQIQERSSDGRMLRTRNRPLPSGRMTVHVARFIALGWLAVGLTLYWATGGGLLLALGTAIVITYNGVYTPLKRVTPAALLVGGLAGAVPPLTGWVAAGGSPFETEILAVTAIFYLWQVPHFWLLAEKHRSDYLRAGFPLHERELPSSLRSSLMILWVGGYFVGLGCFSGLAGPPVLRWIIPPVLLLAGGATIMLVNRRHSRAAEITLHLSLPLGLFPLLNNIP